MPQFKELGKRHKALEQSFEHMTTHEALLESHQKVKEAHSALLAQREEPIEKASVGVTCDLIDDIICAPIVVATKY